MDKPDTQSIQVELKDADILLKKMVEAGVHYGRRKAVTHPSMKRYLMPMTAHIEIFDLTKTKAGLDEAADLLRRTMKEGKTVLFVGVKPAACGPLKELAEALKQPYVTDRWIGGLLTNFGMVRSRTAFMKDLRQKRETKELEKYPVKERQKLEATLEKLLASYGGVEQMAQLPDLMFLVDARYSQHRTAYREALKKHIPVIVVAGSDNPLHETRVVIPANDKAPKSVRFIVEYLKEQLLTHGDTETQTVTG